MRHLVAIDDSEPARAALEHALAEHPDAECTLLCVVDPAAVTYGEYAHRGTEDVLEEKREEAKALLSEASERAAARGVAVETETVVGRPARSILEYVDENPIDHVVVGSHGRSGLSRILLGSVAERIVRRSPVPVTVVR